MNYINEKSATAPASSKTSILDFQSWKKSQGNSIWKCRCFLTNFSCISAYCYEENSTHNNRTRTHEITALFANHPKWQSWNDKWKFLQSNGICKIRFNVCMRFPKNIIWIEPTRAVISLRVTANKKPLIRYEIVWMRFTVVSLSLFHFKRVLIKHQDMICLCSVLQFSTATPKGWAVTVKIKHLFHIHCSKILLIFKVKKDTKW